MQKSSKGKVTFTKALFMKVKLVIFNLATLLKNYNYYISSALKNAFEEDGIILSEEDLSSIAGIPDVVAIRQILRSQEEYDELNENSLLRRKYKSYTNNLIKFFEQEKNVSECEGVSETLKTLNEHKIKVTVISNLPMAVTNILIKKTGWAKNKLVSRVITTNSVLTLSPSPEIIFIAMKKSGITDSKQVAKVGATPYDLIQGTAAGCGIVIGVPSEVFQIEELFSVNHQNFANEIPQIFNFIELSNAVLA